MKLIYIYIIAFLAPAMCSKTSNIPAYFESGDVKWDAEDKVFILFRHAEKQSGDDPELTEQGLERAQRMATYVKSISDFTAYSTNFKRTLATIRPLAEQANKKINIYDHKKLDQFAKGLEESEPGINFISGHSNTTPKLANTLCNCDVFPKIDESDYTNIYIVVQSPQVVKTFLLKY